jgi:hypothetical protein
MEKSPLVSHLLKYAILFSFLPLLGCSDSSDPCAKSWQMLKNPRLDAIADEVANLNAKIASGRGTQEDSQKIYQLKQEEDRIWNRAISSCR